MKNTYKFSRKTIEAIYFDGVNQLEVLREVVSVLSTIRNDLKAKIEITIPDLNEPYATETKLIIHSENWKGLVVEANVKPDHNLVIIPHPQYDVRLWQIPSFEFVNLFEKIDGSKDEQR